jgi:hypothetical protein
MCENERDIPTFETKISKQKIKIADMSTLFV